MTHNNSNSFEAKVLARAAQDIEFRRSLIANPHAAIEAAFGAALPKEIKINVVEESEKQVHLVLPALAPTRELTDSEMELVAGGITLAPAPTASAPKSPVLNTLWGRNVLGDAGSCCFGSTEARTTTAATCGEKCFAPNIMDPTIRY